MAEAVNPLQGSKVFLNSTKSASNKPRDTLATMFKLRRRVKKYDTFDDINNAGLTAGQILKIPFNDISGTILTRTRTTNLKPIQLGALKCLLKQKSISDSNMEECEKELNANIEQFKQLRIGKTPNGGRRTRRKTRTKTRKSKSKRHKKRSTRRR